MANLVNDMLDVLHDESLPTIGLLQASFPNQYKFMINISTLFDPRYVFLIYAPILFALNKRVGHRMLIALTWAEWANQILKWLLAGERPYWYVHERANELAQQRNFTLTNGLDEESEFVAPHYLSNSIQALTGQLKQFPVTCELGAGSPSGHAMVTATVWYILIDAYLRNELQLTKRVDYNQLHASGGSQTTRSQATDLLAKLFWLTYGVMLLLVSLSRVYLACHFPHQCAAGALLGCIMARFVANKLPMHKLRRRHFCLATVWMFVSAMATYAILRATGFNPLWSVDKAMRWCVNSAYIHMDTTPFFSMMRYLGFCLGAGLAYNSSKLAATAGEQRPKGQLEDTRGRVLANAEQAANGGVSLAIRRLIVALVAIGFGQLLHELPLPRGNQQLFYASTFLMYTLYSYAMAGPIPDLVKATLTFTTVNRGCEGKRQIGGANEGMRAHMKQM